MKKEQNRVLRHLKDKIVLFEQNIFVEEMQSSFIGLVLDVDENWVLVEDCKISEEDGLLFEGVERLINMDFVESCEILLDYDQVVVDNKHEEEYGEYNIVGEATMKKSRRKSSVSKNV